MKKKILIVIFAVAMMIPLLAVGVSADYSSETGWDAPVGTFEPFEADVLLYGQLVPFSLGTHFEADGEEINFLYKLVFNSWPERASSDTVLISGLAFVLHMFGIGEDGAAHDAYVACNYLRLTSGNSIDGQGLGHILYFKMIGSDFEVQVDLATQNAEFYLMLYPFGEAAVGQALEGYSFEVYEAATDTTHPFLALIELMFDNFSRIIGGFAAGVTGAFTALIWENPEATEKTLSTAAKFIFTIAGLSIGMTVFYLVLRLIRFGRQR